MRPTITILLGLLAPAALASSPKIPVEHFTQEDTYSQPRLAPDGRHIAVNVRLMRNGRMIPTMSVYSLPERELVSTIALQGYEIPVDFHWLTNKRLVVAKGLEVGLRVAPVATGEIVAVNLDGTEAQYLYGYKGFRQSSRGDRYGDDHGYAEVAHIPAAGDGKVMLGTYLWNSKRSTLYEIDSRTSVRKLLANIGESDLSFIVQHNGKPRFAVGNDDNNLGAVHRKDDASDTWRKLDNVTPGSRFYPFAFTADDTAVYVSHSVKGGPYAVLREELATGMRTMLASDDVGNMSTLEYTASPAVPFGVASVEGIPRTRYLDATVPEAVLHKTLSAAFPDAYVHFINFTEDGQTLLFSVRSDRDPGSYYLYNRKTAKADLLFTNMEQIEPDRMAERRPVSFAARDGLMITGFLTMPANPEKARLPMVLLPHGGPFGIHDDWFFDTDAQFLASRGYAVLQVNYRGSGGRGERFEGAGFREYGGKMMNDLIDGVKWANMLPDIDAHRVCVFGASFGGYAAMMLPVREPTMFKCAIGYAGLYSLAGKYDVEAVQGNARSYKYLVERVGNDRAILDANSPTMLADQIKVPVMLVHGGNDKRTPVKHARTLREALTKAGRPPEWMLEDDEGHGFYDAARRKAFYEKLEAFLGTHIGKPDK